MFKLSHL